MVARYHIFCFQSRQLLHRLYGIPSVINVISKEPEIIHLLPFTVLENRFQGLQVSMYVR